MNMLSKKVILPLAAVAFVGAAAFSASVASADTTGTGTQTSLVQKLADTFHVDKSKVQAVFDADRADRQAQMETKYEERLTAAVTAGTLTEAQKTAILAEHKTLKSKMEALKDSMEGKTMEERRTAMDAIRTEGETWAKTNNVDAKWLMPMGGGHMHGGPGGPGMMAPDSGDAPTPSASPSAS